MLSSPNILFIKDVVQISTEQLDGVIFLLNSLFNRFFFLEKMQFCGYSSVFSPTAILSKLKASSISCSTPFSHFRKPNEEEKCFSSNKLLSAPFEVQPVAELRTNTVLWTDSRVERTSSAE